MRKRIPAIILSVTLLLPLLFIYTLGADIVDSGVCGENLTWTLDSDGLLTVSGTGPMTDFSSSSPWYNNASVKTLVIKSGVTSIAERAFTGCTSLKNVTLPETISKIGALAFPHCTELTSITIPNGVTEIGYGAFNGCTGLKSIIIPNSVTAVGRYAFQNCTNLTEVTSPGSMDEIDTSCFLNCPLQKLTLTSDVDGKLVRNFGGYNLESVIISESVTAIGDLAFASCKKMTALTLSDGIANIGFGAFMNCTGLTSIAIPNSVTEIGNSAFEDCTELKSITLSNSISKMGNHAFSGCTGLTSITIPDGVTEIGADAFVNCAGITSISIPNSVTEIGAAAFLNCTGITSINIPNSVTEIGSSAFKNCMGLTDITIPDCITKIKSETFCHTGLTSVVIPNSVTEIEDKAFQECTNLTALTSPGNFNRLGAYCFGNCPIRDLTLTSHVTTELMACINKAYLRNVALADSETSIDDDMFYGFRQLAQISIPNGVKSIGDCAFASCEALESLTIPNSVTSIGDSAFDYCEKLENVTIPDSVASIGWQTDGPRLQRRRPAITYASVSGNVTSASQKTDYTFTNGEIDHFFHFVSSNDPVTLQDAAGNLYALCGLYTDTVSLISKADGQRASYFCKDFSCGAGVIGDDNRLYLLWARNADEDVRAANAANVQVRQYDLTGREIGCCAFPIEKTQSALPFHAGNAALVCREGRLLVLWNTVWTNGHQGLEQAIVQTSDMTQISLATNVGSHSFGVAALPSARGFAYVQLNDAYSRGINLQEISIPTADSGKNIHSIYEVRAFSSPGQYGTNERQLDGNKVYIHYPVFAQSKTTFAVACEGTDVYTSDVFQNSALAERAVYDVYVRILDSTLGKLNAADCAGGTRKDAATGAIADRNLIRITNLKGEELIRNLKIVTLPDGAYCVLWNQYNLNAITKETGYRKDTIAGFDPGIDGEYYIYFKGGARGSSSTKVYTLGELHYAILDERGNILKPDTVVKGSLMSDYNVPPVVAGNTLVWAVREDGKLTWVTLDLKLQQNAPAAPTGNDVAVDNANKIITAAPNKSVNALAALLSDTVIVVDANGKTLSADAIVGTGAQATLSDGATYTVIVPMDANGDGRVNSQDARLALRAAARLSPLDGVFFSAADTNGDGKVNSQDARAALRVAAKLDVVIIK